MWMNADSIYVFDLLHASIQEQRAELAEAACYCEDRRVNSSDIDGWAGLVYLAALKSVAWSGPQWTRILHVPAPRIVSHIL